jgi:hypothetical protein
MIGSGLEAGAGVQQEEQDEGLLDKAKERLT